MPVAQKSNNGKELWMDLGLKIGQALEATKSLNHKFDNFITNDYHYLKKRVENNTIILAGGMGALALLQLVLRFLFKI